MKKALIVLGIIVVGFGVPNLLWLANSTLRITNEGDELLSSIIVYVDEKGIKLSDLNPGQSKFVVLPNSGESTVTVTYNIGEETGTVCHEYIESGMYHVEVDIKNLNKGRCKVSLPIASELLLLKLF